MDQWLWPVPGLTEKDITSGVGNRWGKSHNGIDIGGSKGLSIIASRSGKIFGVSTACDHNESKSKNSAGKWVGKVSGEICSHGYGKVLKIDHKDGYTSIYAHLTSVFVKDGDEVEKGQVIGTLGSTGYSTGPHLHFEIRYKNTVKNPEEFINSSNTIYPALDASQIDIASSNSNISDLPANDNSSTYPLTAKMFTEGKPTYACLFIYIGGVELSYQHGKPNSIMDFNIDRLESAGCKANFTVFDDNWDEIEYALATNYRDISIKYGYIDGLMSPEYKMILQDYSIDFMDTGTILTINAVSEGIYDNLEVLELDLVEKNPKVKKGENLYNPTEAIKAICEYEGWAIGDFAETQDVHRENPYILQNMNPVSYIQSVIIPEAKTSDGEIVVFYMDADENNTCHLVKKSWGENSPSRTYVYQKGYDSPVIDMNFYVKGIFGGTSNLSISTGLKGSIIDTESKQEYQVEENQETVATVATGLYSHMLTNQSIPTMNFGGETRNQVSNKLYYYVKNATTSQYEATMTILGDPGIKLLESIRVINMTDFGYLHHTSGIYLIMGIADSISNGEFRTTLKLIRNGDIDGIELLNPREIVK